MLRIADGLSLPVEAATETFLVVGKRGSGKSSTATRLAEQLIRSKVPIAVLDPVDVWWGLKAGADGTREGGLEVYVFGGEHAELPLEPTAGVLMADTLVDHRINAVFVLRQFSNKEKARFVSEFAEQLFKRNRDVLHLFCEEAHEVMPQNPYGGEEEMLGRMIRLVKLGRTSGIGVSAITQRPASLNKNATTQCEVLVAHRTLGAQDRDALDDWIKYHRLQDQRAEFLASLGELKTGEAWVWAPDFPEDKPIGLRRVQVTMPETYDSRRTPKPGEKRKEPKSLAPVDLEKLGEKMAATRERAIANDPAKLRAEVQRLKGELSRASPTVKLTEQRIEVPVLKDAQIKRLELVLASFDKLTSRFSGVTADMAEAVQPVYKALSVVLSAGRSGNPAGAVTRSGKIHTDVTDRPAVRAASSDKSERHEGRVLSRTSPNAPASTGLTEPQQKIIDVIGELDRRGLEKDRASVARWLAIHPKGGSYGENLGFLRREGYLNGFELNGRATPRPAFVDGWRGVIEVLPDDPKRAALRAIIDWYEKEGTVATREDIAAKLGLHPKGGSYGENLGWLRAMKVVTPKGLAPTDGLFR